MPGRRIGTGRGECGKGRKPKLEEVEEGGVPGARNLNVTGRAPNLNLFYR